MKFFACILGLIISVVSIDAQGGGSTTSSQTWIPFFNYKPLPTGGGEMNSFQAKLPAGATSVTSGNKTTITYSTGAKTIYTLSSTSPTSPQYISQVTVVHVPVGSHTYTFNPNGVIAKAEFVGPNGSTTLHFSNGAFQGTTSKPPPRNTLEQGNKIPAPGFTVPPFRWG